MSDFTQQHFLGCSIRNFNLNMGWADSATTCTVGLVEDDVLFERFDGFIGELVRFQYDDWIFDGILTNIREQKSESGNRTWEVVVSDPRELLDGIQLILANYTGSTFNVPNLYNIYGYLESFGYGRSLINEGGIPWRLVRDAFVLINQSSPAHLSRVPFFIDLSHLPDIPNDYRISSPNISLMDFIQEICELANSDFTVIMAGNFISVITVSRNIPILDSSIYRLLQQLTEYNSMEAGFELQYNTTNKFLVGGQVEQIYFQQNIPGLTASGTGQASGNNPIYDDTIARYWGKDNNGNARLAIRSPVFTNTSGVQESNETFSLDGKPITMPGISTYEYPTDIYELRAALEGRSEWENFLSAYAYGGTWLASGAIPPNKRPPDNQPGSGFLVQSGSIHYGKFDRYIKVPDMKVQVLWNPQLGIASIGPKDLVAMERNAYFQGNHDHITQKVYDYVYNFANEYLDKKFMVRIPFVLAKLDPDNPGALEPQIITSLEPSESAYLEESYIDDAVLRGLVPQFSDLVLNEENKLTCYVRFGPFDFAELDMSEIPEDDYVVQPPFVFVKASIDPELVFLNKTTAFSPRAVITLPGRVKHTDGTETLSILGNIYFNSTEGILGSGRSIENFARWKNQVAADTLLIDFSKYGLVPDLVAVPLKSNVDTYGPWYTNGIQGRTEFIQDPELVPWNFGGFSQLNAVGQASVRDAYANNIIGEAGSVEVPGSPIFDIAHQIFAGGPTITQINTSVGENGVTTTYRLEKWNQNYGKAIRHRIEQFKKNHALRRSTSKKFNKLFKPNSPPGGKAQISNGSLFNSNRKPRRRVINSSHPMIMASTYTKENGFKTSSVANLPFYQVQGVLDNPNWESIGGCSLDALFIPYSTDQSLPVPSGGPIQSGGPFDSTGSGFVELFMPHFETPTIGSGGTTGSGSPTVDDLNPFKQGHSIGVAVLGGGSSGHRNINIQDGESEEIYRGMALRSPIVLAGWGYDTNGNPVPSNLSYGSGQIPGSGAGVSGIIPHSGDQFHPDYLKNPTLWKAGPLDVRWHNNRKCWVAGSSIDKYIKCARTRLLSGMVLFEYLQVDGGTEEWITWFSSADCGFTL